MSTLPPRQRIDVAGLATASFEQIDPRVTLPAFTFAGLSFPAHLVAINVELFREAMAYPVIDIPMYKPLLGLSAEHFLPNIDKIPPNTITLLETNQRFIEAYMAGINHEMARELLWREFPTDQRGTPFRQFWDPSGFMDTDGLDREALREKLRDIPPMHRWSVFENLGSFDNREEPGDEEEEAVLVIRGELLKKYPNTVILAQRARWQRTGGQIDLSLPRLIEDQGDVKDILRTPLYEAKVEPDVTFIGFDLTTAEAKGGSGLPGDDDPGWFFVLKERPGEPRFGLDIEREGGLALWNNLAWPDVFDATADDGFLQIRPTTPTLTLAALPGDATPQEVIQHDEDVGVSWHRDTNAAELAYILYQVPVMVAVHGSEMLPD